MLTLCPMVAVELCLGINYEQRTQLHFIDGNLNTQRYRDEILRPIVLLFICRQHLIFQHYNAWSHVARICTQFLEAENVPVYPWPAYSDMSPIEHIWDSLDRRVRSHVPVPANIHQLRTSIEKEWDNITQATINSLINSMQRRCVVLHEANGGHTKYRLVFMIHASTFFLKVSVTNRCRSVFPVI